MSKDKYGLLRVSALDGILDEAISMDLRPLAISKTVVVGYGKYQL